MLKVTSTNKSIPLNTSKTKSVHLSANTIVTSASSAKVYGGEYEVEPDEQQHILETKGKLMQDDVTVKKIAYYEVTNASGGTTIYIGE